MAGSLSKIWRIGCCLFLIISVWVPSKVMAETNAFGHIKDGKNKVQEMVGQQKKPGDLGYDPPVNREDLNNQLDELMGKYTKYIEMIHKVSSPLANRVQKLMDHPDFTKTLEYIIEFTDWVIFLVAQLVLIVGMIILRAWRFSRVRHWFARLWVSLWTFIFYSLCSTLLVPFLVIGRPFVDLLNIYRQVFLNYWGRP